MILLNTALPALSTGYNYRNPIDIESDALIEPLFRSLISSRPLKRLQHIRFLGGIDYTAVPKPNGAWANRRHTRYQHSVGVALLALRYAKIRNLTPQQTRLILSAALLHDTGHGPLSHTLEPVFEEQFGINHHITTKKIILGQRPFSIEIPSMLQQFGVDPEQIVELLFEKTGLYDGFFSGPINFDTIEGVCRSQRYILPQPEIISPFRILLAATRRREPADARTVDHFWSAKDFVYKKLIKSPQGLIADYIAQDAMRKNIEKFSYRDFYSTEPSLLKRQPALRQALNPHFLSQWKFDVDSFQYTERVFTVNSSERFSPETDHHRYAQFKIERHLHACSDRSHCLTQVREEKGSEHGDL